MTQRLSARLQGAAPHRGLRHAPSRRAGPPNPSPDRHGEGTARVSSGCVPVFPQPGDQAPDFELPGTDGQFKLSAHRGEPVVLLFYPRDESKVCTTQFCFYRDRFEELSALGAFAVGISPQDIDSHERFIASHGLRMPLLSDTGLEVSKAYGVHSRLIGTKRATFVIDGQGIVRYRHENILSLTFDTVDDLRSALAAIS
jgi:peroxiredoxin Q/BCP